MTASDGHCAVATYGSQGNPPLDTFHALPLALGEPPGSCLTVVRMDCTAPPIVRLACWLGSPIALLP